MALAQLQTSSERSVWEDSMHSSVEGWVYGLSGSSEENGKKTNWIPNPDCKGKPREVQSRQE